VQHDNTVYERSNLEFLVDFVSESKFHRSCK